MPRCFRHKLLKTKDDGVGFKLQEIRSSTMSELEGPLLNNKKIGLIAIAVWVAFFVTVGSAPVVAFGQAITVNAGSIQGTITDQSGAIIPNAQVTISNPETGYTHSLRTDASGLYTVGPLNPGTYVVIVTASGFQRLQVTTIVKTGTATNGNFKLTVGAATETIQVNAGAVQLNTDQSNVSGVISQQQFDNLPVTDATCWTLHRSSLAY